MQRFKFKRNARKPGWRNIALNEMGSTRTGPGTVVKTDRVSVVAETVLSSRQLYITTINNIKVFSAASELGVGGIPQSYRLGSEVDLRGWKIRVSIFNRQTQEPLIFHYAIVTPKNDDVVTALRFFRDYNLSRDVNFSTALNGTAMHYPLNPDKFSILVHKKWFVTRANSNDLWNTGAPSQINQKSAEFYVPFKRKITFEDDVASGGVIGPSKSIFAIYWADAPTNPEGEASIVNAINFQHDCIAMYKQQI